LGVLLFFFKKLKAEAKGQEAAALSKRVSKAKARRARSCSSEQEEGFSAITCKFVYPTKKSIHY